MSISYTLSSLINKALKTNVSHYCQLETAKDEYDMVTADGGLVTAYEIKGTFSVVGEEAFPRILRQLADTLSSTFKNPGFRAQFVFRRDPLNSKEALRRSVSSAIKTLNRLQIDLVDMIQEREDLLSRKTVLESCYLILSTSPRALHPEVLKESIKERMDIAAKFGGLKPGDHAQGLPLEVPGVDMLHTGFLSQVESRLSEHLSLTKLTTHEFLSVVRRMVTQYDSSDQWRPYLPGDKLPARLIEEAPRANDLSHLLWPDIGQQMFSRCPRIDDNDVTLVDIGEWKIGTLLVDQRPQQPKSFQMLFNSIDRDVPWQLSMVIESGHDRVTQMVSRKKTFASFVAFASSENKLIRDAATELLEVATIKNMVTINLTFSTWGRTLETTRRNKSKLRTAIEAWGNMHVIEERGDAVEAWVNTLPGFSKTYLATPLPVTIEEAIGMAPITRPVSPWTEGTMLYRTIDEKVFPYMPGSDLQNAMMEIVFAPPGFGKSFYLAASNMGLIARPGNEVLPRIGILDIGFSSSLFVQMIRDSLPDHLKHQAQHFKLEMDARYAINFFDTPLGCQYPLKVDREFVVNMMILLCTPAGQKPIARLPELISVLVDEMYKYFSDDQNPNMYEAGIDPVVDDVLKKNNFNMASDVSWWKIVNMLFKGGYHHEAMLAQRYAVPTFKDATMVLTASTAITDSYGDAETGLGNESLIKYVKSMIISASATYPILSQPTVFSLGDARVVAIDLMNVARDGNDQAEKTTAIMYLLGRYIICKDYYRSVKDTIPEIPDAYKAYHKRVIEKDEAIPKKICMDEYHKTSKVQAVRDQSMVDIREGRKFNVFVTLVSQLLEDFDDKMIKNMNNIVILSKGLSDMTMKEIVEKFSPTKDSQTMVNRYLTGPGREGSSMLYIGQIKGDTQPRVEQILRLTLGPREIWAYSTTPEDVSLRKRLADRIGFSNSIKVLAKVYPRGSAKYDIQRLLVDNTIDVDDLDENTNIFDELVEKLIKENSDLIEYR